MHGGCQFGKFTNLCVVLRLAVPIRETGGARNLKTRANHQETRLRLTAPATGSEQFRAGIWSGSESLSCAQIIRRAARPS